ncbi:MAG: dihydroorotate dehydrogenase electron transfer subunit [Spirochaetaceae bacterium]|jgi:NAD(P)H-flavin reductase|nr:dihydroorotate dehydrogenase electron transfer subunit [Spirochaetaceae bacterium]
MQEKSSLWCKLVNKKQLACGIFSLSFKWEGEEPYAGQFFLIKPRRTSVFLARPLSVAAYKNKRVKFIIAKKGSGSAELCALCIGEEALLTGPLGNTFGSFLQDGICKKAVLAAGGAGIAPLSFFAGELKQKKIPFDFFGGFITKASVPVMRSSLRYAQKTIITTEDGTSGTKGLIIDFIDTEMYSTKNKSIIFCCGPLPMMQALGEKCKQTGTNLFVSLEKRMACGVGACLGCTVATADGNERCCCEGPVFNAQRIIF